MDDVKLYLSNDVVLKRLIRTVEQFSRDIRMKFGTDKCRVDAFRKGLEMLRGIKLTTSNYTVGLKTWYQLWG